MAFEETEYTGKSFEPKIWKRLFPFLKRYRALLVMILVLNLYCALVDIVNPLLQRYAIDTFIAAGTTKGLALYAVCCVLIILCLLYTSCTARYVPTHTTVMI